MQVTVPNGRRFTVERSGKLWLIATTTGLQLRAEANVINGKDDLIAEFSLDGAEMELLSRACLSWDPRQGRNDRLCFPLTVVEGTKQHA